MRTVKILDQSQLADIDILLENITFQDGKKSAKGLAKKVKKNQEAMTSLDGYAALSGYISKVHVESDWLKKRYLPKKFSNPIINKYTVGNTYGRHFDASHMLHKLTSIKKDFSFTLMLSKASAYDGGELEIESGNLTHKVKLDAGDMVIYPSMYMHNILPITQGERVAYVGWFASHIKDHFALETLNSYEDMYLALMKYELSEDDQISLGYVQNRLQHLLSD